MARDVGREEEGGNGMPTIPLEALPPQVRQIVTRAIGQPLFVFHGEEFWITDPDVYLAAAQGYYVVKALLRFLSPLHTMAKAMGTSAADAFAGNELSEYLSLRYMRLMNRTVSLQSERGGVGGGEGGGEEKGGEEGGKEQEEREEEATEEVGERMGDTNSTVCGQWRLRCLIICMRPVLVLTWHRCKSLRPARGCHSAAGGWCDACVYSLEGQRAAALPGRCASSALCTQHCRACKAADERSDVALLPSYDAF